jgi:ubiquinone biosynthesis protein UbiJ
VFTQPTVAVLNHLLTQSGWALQRLARFSGKTARFQIAPFSFSCTVQDDGSLREAASDVSPDATCVIPPSLLPRLALHDEAAFKQIDSCGDAALLTEIFFLGRNLRWDAAEDLSRVTGDIAAERIVKFAQATQQQLRGAALNLSQALAEYWTEERPLIAGQQQLAAFKQQVDGLRDDMGQLELRIKALTPSPSPASGRGEE